MKASELIEILNVLIEDKLDSSVKPTSDRLWLAYPGELSDVAQMKLSKLGCGYESEEGWYVFF